MVGQDYTIPTRRVEIPMDDVVAKLVARYQTDHRRPEGKSLSIFSNEEDLVQDLRRELDDILGDRDTPFPMKLYMVTVMKALQILRGQQ